MGAKGDATKKLDASELERTVFTVNSSKREVANSLSSAKTTLMKMSQDDTLNNNQGEHIKEAAEEAVKAVDNILENIQKFAAATDNLLARYYEVAKKETAASVKDSMKAKAATIASKS